MMSTRSSRSPLAHPLCVLLVALPASALLAADPVDPEARIRSIRAAFKAALAAGDMDTFVASLDEDYAGTGGSGGHVQSREQLAERVGARIDAAPGLHYVRTPQHIEVGDGGTRAFETGYWVEVHPDASEGLGGRYSAHWRKRDGRWVIHGELFVTLERPDED